MKLFYMKIDLISQGRENVLFLPSNMAAMTSHENALYGRRTDTGIDCRFTCGNRLVMMALNSQNSYNRKGR